MLYRSFFALMVVFLLCIGAEISVYAQSEQPRDPLEAHLWARRQVDPKELTTRHDYTKTVAPKTKSQSKVFRKRAVVIKNPPVPGSKPVLSGGEQAQIILGAPVVPGKKPGSSKVMYSPPPPSKTTRKKSRVFAYSEDPRTAGMRPKVQKNEVEKKEVKKKPVVQPNRPAVLDEVVAVANSIVKPKAKPSVAVSSGRASSESVPVSAHVPVKPSFKPVRGFNVVRSLKTDAGAARVETTEVRSNFVSDIRIGNHPGKTRLVFDVKVASDFTVDAGKAGKSLAIAFKDTAMHAALEYEYRSHALLSGYESYVSDQDIKIVFGLKKPVKVLARYVLPPDGSQTHYRVVVDIAQR